jgi:hypothetical protein
LEEKQKPFLFKENKMAWTLLIGCAGIIAISVPIVVAVALMKKKREKVNDNPATGYIRWGGFES